MKRKPITKETRQQVYAKCGGCCAYCGRTIRLDEMQVDHAIAYAQAEYGYEEERRVVQQMIDDGSIDSLDNLMPSCRACNFYKGGWDIERFRNRILRDLDHTCRSSFQTRLAMQYGMIQYRPWDGRFYFEKLNKYASLLQNKLPERK